MLAEQTARVLDAEIALHERLEQIADVSRQADHRTEEERLVPVDPVHPDPGHRDGHRTSDQADDEALHGLVGRGARRDRPPSEKAPPEVREGVERPRADQDVGDGGRTEGQIAERHQETERDPDVEGAEGRHRHTPGDVRPLRHRESADGGEHHGRTDPDEDTALRYVERRGETHAQKRPRVCGPRDETDVLQQSHELRDGECGHDRQGDREHGAADPDGGDRQGDTGYRDENAVDHRAPNLL